MEPLDPDRLIRHTAYHEAGHVIADIVFGYRFSYVTIRPEDSEEYEGVVYGSARGRARNLAVIQLAGIVASSRMAGYDPWENPPVFDDDSADIATARGFIDTWAAFVSQTYGEPGVRERLWAETEREARDLVEKNWDAITAVAFGLLERGSLTYPDVMQILAEQCPGFPAPKK